jgi:hypothetical protein
LVAFLIRDSDSLSGSWIGRTIKSGCELRLNFPAPVRRIVNVTITRLGSNPKLAQGWDAAFGGKKGSSAKKEAAAKPAPKKAPAKKAKAKGKK